MGHPYCVWKDLLDDMQNKVLKHACLPTTLEVTLERKYMTSEPDLWKGDIEVCEKWCFKRTRPPPAASFRDFGPLTVTLTRYLSPSMSSRFKMFRIDENKISTIQNRVSYKKTWSSVTSIKMKAETHEKEWSDGEIETFYVYRLHLYQDTTEGENEMEETPESHLPKCCFFEDAIERFENDLQMNVTKHPHHGADQSMPPNYTVFQWLPADDDA